MPLDPVRPLKLKNQVPLTPQVKTPVPESSKLSPKTIMSQVISPSKALPVDLYTENTNWPNCEASPFDPLGPSGPPGGPGGPARP